MDNEFIKTLFNSTNNLIEIREIPYKKNRFYTVNEIETYDPPSDKDIYFGVFTRKTKVNGKADNCQDTKVLWVDYDGFKNLTVEQKLIKVKGRLINANIPKPSIYVNSGHGIHAYWLLSERAGEEAVIISKAIARKTNADIRTSEKARVMRLPGTYNNKNKSDPVKCEIISADYDLIYDIGTFKHLFIDVKGVSKTDTPLTITGDRPCITEMLSGVPEGERNFALGRITKWLQLKGYTKIQAREIIKQWNKLNDPPEEESKVTTDFENYWHGNYKLLGCLQKNPDLQQILYKYCNRPECNFAMAIGHIELDNTIKYNNRLLNDFSCITGNDLLIYGLLVRHLEGLTTSLLTEKLTSRALKKPCMTKKTMLKSIDNLNALGFVEIVTGNRRLGKENLYKALLQGTYGLGYTLATNGAINGCIDKRITPGMFRLYVLLLKYAFGKGSCYPSLSTMSKELRTSIYNISMQLNKLEKSDYIKRSYSVIKGVEKLDIKLLV